MTTPNQFTPPPLAGPGDTTTDSSYGAPSAYGAPATGAYPAAPAAYGAPQGGAGQNGPSGLTRSPVGVFLLAIVTFGIYAIVWYYKVNVELKNFNSSIQVNPVNMILLSLFVPFFFIVSIYYTGQRIQQAQAAAGLPVTTSPGIGLLLAILIGGHSFYYQDALNNVWQYRQA